MSRSTSPAAPAATAAYGCSGSRSPSTTGWKTRRRKSSERGCVPEVSRVMTSVQLLDRHLGEGGRGRRDAELGAELGGDDLGALAAVHVVRRAALRDRPPEQAARARHGQQRAHGHRAGRLARDGHPGRVAAEARDLVADPLERGDHVAQAAVRRRVGEEREPLGGEAVVDRHRDDAVTRERRAVEGRGRAGARGEAAAVDEDEDRGTPGHVRCPDVEVQPVLPRPARVGQQLVHHGRALRRRGHGRPEGGGVGDPVVRHGRARRVEPGVADRRRGVRDAQERPPGGCRRAPEGSLPRADVHAESPYRLPIVVLLSCNIIRAATAK
jgi:hypothetical protein